MGFDDLFGNGCSPERSDCRCDTLIRQFTEFKRHFVSKVSHRSFNIASGDTVLTLSFSDRSRAESVVSNVAVERLLKSGKSDQRYLYPFVRFCSRWALVLLFFWTVLFSTFYMIERLARMSVKANVFVLLFLALMSVLLLFSLWSALLFVLKIILQRFIPQSRVKSKARKILKAINERIIVKGIASTLFGVDTTDMEGGESSRPPKLTTVAAFLVSLYLLPAMMKCWHTSRDWRPCYRIKHLPMQWVKV